MFNQLLLNTVEQLTAQEKQRKDLGMARAMLQARLRMLKGQDTTIAAAFEEAAPADPTAEINGLEQELARTSGAIGELGGGVDALDKELEVLVNVLTHAADVLQLSERKLRIDQFNTVVEPQSTEGAEIEFVVLRIAGDPPRTRAAVFVRFDRGNLGRGGLAIDEVARSL
jgi:chromosome segregation ATPase